MAIFVLFVGVGLDTGPLFTVTFAPIAISAPLPFSPGDVTATAPVALNINGSGAGSRVPVNGPGYFVV